MKSVGLLVALVISLCGCGLIDYPAGKTPEQGYISYVRNSQVSDKNIIVESEDKDLLATGRRLCESMKNGANEALIEAGAASTGADPEVFEVLARGAALHLCPDQRNQVELPKMSG